MALKRRSAAAHVAAFVVAGIAVGLFSILLKINPVEGSVVHPALRNFPLVTGILLVLSFPGWIVVLVAPAFLEHNGASTSAVVFYLAFALGQSIAYGLIGAAIWYVRSVTTAKVGAEAGMGGGDAEV